MLPELLALLGGFFFSLGAIYVRRKLVESNFFSATVIITLIGTIILCILALLLGSKNSVNPIGVVYFSLAGIFTGLARLNLFKGIERLGVSMNASIFATHPLFGSLLAVLLLGEHPSIGIWVGMICIICGVILIERNVHRTPVKSSSLKRKDIALPLSAALFVGIGFILRKLGLNMYNEPIVGVAIAYPSALGLYILILGISTNIRRSISFSRRSFQIFWKAGVIFSLAHLCFLYALRHGDVSLVAPLMNIEPFFVFILAYIFLREMEKITPKLLAGAIMIVAGVSLITF